MFPIVDAVRCLRSTVYAVHILFNTLNIERTHTLNSSRARILLLAAAWWCDCIAAPSSSLEPIYKF